MDNKQLYDAISGIDDDLTNRVSAALTGKERNFNKVPKKQGLKAILIVTALLLVAATSVLLITFVYKNGKTPFENTRHIRCLRDTDMIEIKYEGAGRSGETDGENVKELMDTTGIYVEFTYPSQIKNGGAFEFMLSMGLDKDYHESIESLEGGVIDSRSPMVQIISEYLNNGNRLLPYNRYISLIVTSDHTYNGVIPFDLSDYQKYAETCLNEDFIFEGNKGMFVEEIPTENGEQLFMYKFGPDFTLDGPLPYSRSVSAEAFMLKNGDSGRISASVHFTKGEGSLMESRGETIGHRMYYYCAGDVIGFGETLEEAQANASSSETRNIVYIFDGYSHFVEESERLQTIYEEYKKRGMTIVW